MDFDQNKEQDYEIKCNYGEFLDCNSVSFPDVYYDSEKEKEMTFRIPELDMRNHVGTGVDCFSVPSEGDTVAQIYLKPTHSFMKHEDMFRVINNVILLLGGNTMLKFSGRLLYILHKVHLKKDKGEIAIPMFPIHLNLIWCINVEFGVKLEEDIASLSKSRKENIFDISIKYQYFKERFKPHVKLQRCSFNYVTWGEYVVPKSDIKENGTACIDFRLSGTYEFWFLFESAPFEYLSHNGPPRVSINPSRMSLGPSIEITNLSKMEGVTIPVYVLSFADIVIWEPDISRTLTIFTLDNILKKSRLIMIYKLHYKIHYKDGYILQPFHNL